MIAAWVYSPLNYACYVLDSIIGFLTLISSLVLHCRVDGMCCQLKKKKVLVFLPPKDSTLSSPVKKRKEKKKILAHAYIANGYGIDSQVPNSSYIKVITAT